MSYHQTRHQPQSAIAHKPLRLRYPAHMTLLSHVVANLPNINSQSYLHDDVAIPPNLANGQTLILTDNMDVFLSDAAKSQQLSFLYIRKQRDVLSKLVPDRVLATLEGQDEAVRWILRNQLRDPPDILVDERYSADSVAQIIRVADRYHMNVFLNGKHINQPQMGQMVNSKPNFSRCIWLRTQETEAENELYQPLVGAIDEFDFMARLIRVVNRPQTQPTEGSFIALQQVEKCRVTQQNIIFSAPPAVLIGGHHQGQQQYNTQVRGGLPSEIKENPEPVQQGPSFINPPADHFLFIDIDPVTCRHLQQYCLRNDHEYVRVVTDAELRYYLNRVNHEYHTVLIAGKDQAHQLSQNEDLLRTVRVVISCFNPMGPSTDQINLKNRYNAFLIGDKNKLIDVLDKGAAELKVLNTTHQLRQPLNYEVRQMQSRPVELQPSHKGTILPPVPIPLPFVQTLNSQMRPQEISFVETIDPSKQLMHLQYGLYNAGNYAMNTAPARMVEVHQLKPKEQRVFPEGVPVDSINSSNFPVIETEEGKLDTIKQNNMEQIAVPGVLKSAQMTHQIEPVTQMSRIVRSHSERSNNMMAEQALKLEQVQHEEQQKPPSNKSRSQKQESLKQSSRKSEKQESQKQESDKSSLKKDSVKSGSKKQKLLSLNQNTSEVPQARVQGLADPALAPVFECVPCVQPEIPVVAQSQPQNVNVGPQTLNKHPTAQTIQQQPIESGVCRMESNENMEALSRGSNQSKSSKSADKNTREMNRVIEIPNEAPAEHQVVRLNQAEPLQIPKLMSQQQPLQPHSIPSSSQLSEVHFPEPILPMINTNNRLMDVPQTVQPVPCQIKSTPQIQQKVQTVSPTACHSQNVLPTSYPINAPLPSILQRFSSQGSRLPQQNFEQIQPVQSIVQPKAKTLQSLQPKIASSSTSLKLQEQKLSGVASVSAGEPTSGVQPSSMTNLSNQSSVQSIPLAQYGNGLQDYIKKRSEPSQGQTQHPTQPVTLRKLYDDRYRRLEQPMVYNTEYSQQPLMPHTIRTIPVASPAIRQTLYNNFPMTSYPISQAKQTILLQYKYLDDFAKSQPVVPAPTHVYIFETLPELLEMLKNMSNDPSVGIVVKTIYSAQYSRLPLAPNVIIKKYLGNIQGTVVRTMSGRNKLLSPSPGLRWPVRYGRVSTEPQRYRSHETILSRQGSNILRYRLKNIESENGQNDQQGSPVDKVASTPRRSILNSYIKKMFNRQLVYILVNQKEQHLIENIHRQKSLNQRIRLQTYLPGQQKRLVSELSVDNICILICRDEQTLQNVKEFLKEPNFQILYLNKQRYVYANQLQMENFFQLTKRGQVVRLIQSIPRFYSAIKNKAVLDYETISIYFQSSIPKQYKTRILSLAERQKSRIVPHQISNHHEVLQTADNSQQQMFIAVIATMEMFNLLNSNRPNIKIFRADVDKQALNKQLQELNTLVEDQGDRRKRKTKIKTQKDEDDGFDRRLAAVEFKKFLKDAGDQDSQLWINREYYDERPMEPEVVRTYVNHFGIRHLDRMPSGRNVGKVQKYQMNEYQQMPQDLSQPLIQPSGPPLQTRIANWAQTFSKPQNTVTVNKMQIQQRATEDANKMNFAQAVQQAINGNKPIEVINEAQEVSQKNTKSKKSKNLEVTSRDTEQRSNKLKESTKQAEQTSQQPKSNKSSSKKRLLHETKQANNEKPDLCLTGQRIIPKDTQIQQKKSISIHNFDKLSSQDPYELNSQNRDNKKESHKEDSHSSKNAHSSKKSSGLQQSRASSQKVASSTFLKRKSEKKLMRVPPLQDQFQDDSQHLSQSQFKGQEQRSDVSAPAVVHLSSSMKDSGMTKSNDKKQ